jgi:hypothetical protein
VRLFYFRAYDQTGHKRTGAIEAPNVRAADAELRKSGLRPYFLNEYEAVRKALREKRKRERLLILGGSLAIALSLVLSGQLVRYAGRERAPDVEDYKRAGILDESSGVIVAKTKEEREFALEIYKIWDGFYPDLITGVDVKRLFMTVYVSRQVYDLSENELELLATNTTRALQRRFETSGATLLIVEGDNTVMEVNYASARQSLRVRSYR